ncbi:UNVERIFIED_CONTAM: hypothetical protein RMT77_004234 [Armadillidium vulgare]
MKCISFSGCGFMSPYLLGAATCLEKHYPHIFTEVSFSGASAGALLAACLACKVPLEIIKKSVIATAADAQLWTLGPFSPNFNIEDYILKGLSNLPSDAHIMASGRVFVSLTRFKDFRNVIISQWDSRDELIQTLICSCFIPLFSGIKTPTLHGEKYIDGGFSNNLPIAKKPSLTISPFAGNSDICPKDNYKNPPCYKIGNHKLELTPKNINRFIRAIMPPSVELLELLFKEGFLNAKYFIKNSV